MAATVALALLFGCSTDTEDRANIAATSATSDAPSSTAALGTDPAGRDTDSPNVTDLIEILALAVRESCATNFCPKARPVYVVVPKAFDVDVSLVASAVRRESDLLAEPIEANDTEGLYSDTSPNLADGGTIVSMQQTAAIIDGVYALDVSVSRGRHDLVIETYLFKPSTERTWSVVPHSVVGVTLTSSVS